MILSPLYRFITTVAALLTVALVGLFATAPAPAATEPPAASVVVQEEHGPLKPRQDVLDAIREADARTSVSYR